MDIRHYIVVVWCSLLLSTPSYGEVIPDFYAEPGISQYRESVNTSLNESIDPLSGTLHFVHTDGLIPGNGGMDLSIVRSYTSMQGSAGVGPRTVTGIGWTNHFGRVLSINTDGCTGDPSTMNDNPVIELRDGSRFTLAGYNNNITGVTNISGISKERWNGGCAIDSQGNFDATRYKAYSPEGLRYNLDEWSFENGEKIWHVTRITDPNDNWIDVSYKEVGGSFVKYKVIDRVTSSDGRSVQYTYINENTENVLLGGISSHGRSWSFSYVSAGIANYYYLSEVQRPDGQRWQYDYYTTASGLSPELYSLKSVIYPQGAINTYTYQSVVFDVLTGTPVTSVSDKVVSNAGSSNGTWSYSFSPANLFDTTTVTTPNGQIIYKHYGIRGLPLNMLWRVGLLKEKQTIDDQAGLVKKETYEWGSQFVSPEKYTRPTLLNDVTLVDDAYYAPIMTKSTIVQDGSTYVTEYLNHDAFGNPGTIIETGDDTKQTDLTYFYNLDKWIVKKVKNETIEGVGSILRSYDADTGNLLAESKYGVVTSYTYHPSGDIATIKNPRGYVTSYSNYKRGIAQLEVMPEQVSTSRVINDTGTVASKTNGRGYTTSFTYDSMNRLISIDYPINSDVSIVYTGLSYATLTRGAFEMVTEYDNIGQTVSVEQKDTLRGVSILQTTKYNAVGQAVFKSYPYNGPKVANPDGTSTTFDILDRPLTITHPDLTKVKYDYLSGNRVNITNERLFQTMYSYRSYGDPDEKSLIQIDSPEAITTSIQRNKLDQIKKVTQGAFSRDYTYDSRYYLISRNDPEVGLTEFSRNAVGDIVDITVAGSGTLTNSYDELNRLRKTSYHLVSYPSDLTIRNALDVNYFYDYNSNIVKMESTDIGQYAEDANAFSDVVNLTTFTTTRNYTYDAKDNLINESLNLSTDRNGQIFGNNYVTQYFYTNLDFLSYMVYPKGTTASYNPDALGRATNVLPFISSVSYHPNGTPSQLVFANGQISQTSIDVRQRPTRYQTFGNSNDVDLTYSYDDMGNVISISDGLEPQYSRSLTYDGIDRLKTASGIWGSGSINYDAVGNITSKIIGGESLSYNYDATNKLSSVSGSKSLNYNYDPRGNVIGTGTNSFYYDYSERLRMVDGGNTTYDYDGNGLRVRKTVGAEVTEHFYASNGNLLGDYAGDGTTFIEYAYLGSQLVAMRDVSLIPPDARAGADQTAYEGTPITLDGSASSDSDGEITLYNWTQISGPTATLDNPSSASPTFVAPEVTVDSEIVFQLTVGDDDTNSDTDTVSISIYDTSPPAIVSGVFLTQESADITVHWDITQKADSYNIYWSTTPGLTLATGNKISNASSPYLHGGLASGVTYYYIVTGVNAYGESLPSPIVSLAPGVNGVSTPATIGLTSSPSGEIETIIDNPDGTKSLYYTEYVDGIGWQLYRVDYDPATGWDAPVIELEFGSGIANVIFDKAGNGLSVVQNNDQIIAKFKKFGQPWGAETVVYTTSESVRNVEAALSLNGTAHITWDEFCCGFQGRYYIKTSTFDASIGSWSSPATFDSYINNAIDTKLVTNNNGDALLFTHDTRNDGLTYYRFDDGTKSWGNNVVISGIAGRFDVTISESGYVVAHYRSTVNTSEIRAVAFTPNLTSTAVQNSIFTVDTLNSVLPEFSINNNGHGVAIWNSEDGRILSKLFDPVLGWASEYGFVGYGDANRSDIIIDDLDNIFMSWIYDTPRPSTFRSVMFNYSPAGGNWGNQIRISQFDKAASSNSPSRFISLSLLDGNKALINWEQGEIEGAGYGVYSSTYTYFGSSSAQQNSAPLALTGNDVITTEQAFVTLDASPSLDVDGSIVSYEWSQTSGTSVSLNNANTNKPNFVAPLTVVNMNALIFQVKVTDNNGAISYASQQVTVRDLPSPSLVTVLSDVTGNIISWSAQEGSDSYNVYWGTTAGVLPTTGTLIQNVTSPYVHTGLTEGQDYYYIVVSVNANGESRVLSEYKATWKNNWQSPFIVESAYESTQPNHLSANSSGDSTLVWDQSTPSSGINDIYVSLFDSSTGWIEPLKLNVQQDLHSKPISATNEDGSRVVVWGYTDGTTFSLLSSIYTATVGWSSPTVVSSSSSSLAIDAYDIANDGLGNAIVVWESNASLYASRYVVSSGWSASSLLGSGKNPRISMTQNGQAVVSWLSDNVGGAVGSKNLWTARYAIATGWMLSEQVQGDVSGLTDGPIASIDDTGSVLLVWNELSTYGYSSIQSMQYISATGWTAPYIVDFDDANTTGLGLSSDYTGKQFISWLRQEANGTQSLFVRRFDAASGWDDIELIDLNAGNIEAASVHVNALGEAALIWRKADIGTPSNKSVYASLYSANGWSAPVQVSNGHQTASSMPPTIKLSDTGDALAIWDQKVNSDYYDSLSMNHYRKAIGVPANARPTAGAGANQTVNINETATLDASSSVDSDGTIVNYTWTQLTGPSVTLDVTNPVAPTFTAPSVIADVAAVFQLNVTDDKGDIHSDSVSVTITNPLFNNSVKPIVTAPADITVEATATTTPISAAVLGAGTAVDDVEGALATTSDAPASFPLGINTVTWSATDTAGNTGTATQVVTIVDTVPPSITPPADAGVQSDTPVSISIGTASVSDIFGPVSISNDAPSLFPVGVTTVTWTATDANGNSATATQAITVTATPVVNSAPVIDGINAAFVGNQIQLIASASDSDNGPSPLSYQWSIVSGGGSLSTATGATTFYNLPSNNVTVTFKLIVSDGQDSAQTNYTLTIGSGSGSSNQAPYATAFNAYYIASNQIQLIISATDPDGGPSPLSYQWTIVSGGGSLSNANTANPVYTTTGLSPGTYTIYFNVAISDGEDVSPYTLPLTITIF